MPNEGRGILSPVRLPVPPLQQNFDSFELTVDSWYPHCSGSCSGSRETSAHFAQVGQLDCSVPGTDHLMRLSRAACSCSAFGRILPAVRPHFAGRHHRQCCSDRIWNASGGRLSPWPHDPGYKRVSNCAPRFGEDRGTAGSSSQPYRTLPSIR